MSDEVELLAELMLQSEVFCSRVEAGARRRPPQRDHDELRLKISQCRGALRNLQSLYEADQLTIETPAVRGDFRCLIMSLLWIAFLAGSLVDRRLFRRLVQIESGFTYLLIRSNGSRQAEEKDGSG